MVQFKRQSLRRPQASALIPVTLIAASMLACDVAVAQHADELRMARYTTASAAPDVAQLEPLEAIVQIGFPRSQVQTVGEAVAYLLLRTGYRLAHPQEADTRSHAVLALPLPEVHRRLGPCTVRTALSVLLGKAFVLSTDPVQRLVSYRVEDAARERSTTLSAGEVKAARVPGGGSAQ